jgi:hypothetical protein
MRHSGLSHFNHGVARRSPHRRAMAFAALGAAEVLAVDPRHGPARDLLADAIARIGPLPTDDSWLWPEPRRSYANAVLPEALVAAGDLLGRPEVVEDGLSLLRWLLDRETLDGHLSPTPVGGAGPNDHAPAFDQQPIEVAAIADACARAAAVTGDQEWRRGVDLAVQWFAGGNDAGAVMWDPETGGGYDGLQASGPNLNQGAESTLALISTMQHSRDLATRRTDARVARPVLSGQAGEQLVERDRDDARADVGVPVGQHEVVGVNHAAARVHDVGHVSLALVDVGAQQRLVEVADDLTRLVEVEEKCAQCVAPHWPDTVGDHEPTCVGLER